MITVTVNGERREVPDGTSIRDLVVSVTGRPIESPASSQHPAPGYAVALDDEVLPVTEWSCQVHEDARVEILTAVQGGSH